MMEAMLQTLKFYSAEILVLVSRILIYVSKLLLYVLKILLRIMCFFFGFVVKFDCTLVQVIITVSLHLQLLSLCGPMLLLVKCGENLTKNCCKLLMRLRIVPAKFYQVDKEQEDVGVLEMRAWLRGEDFSREFNQTHFQVRPTGPQNINPHGEFCMAAVHYQSVNHISSLYASLKQNKKSSSHVINLYFEFLDDLVSYVTSFDAVNWRI